MGVNGVAVGTLAVGSVLVWTGLKGGSVLAGVQSMIQGQKPTGENVHSIDIAAAVSAGGLDSQLGALSGAGASAVLTIAQQVANSPAGKSRYCWGGGHSGNPCSASCFDCSGYVSCVLNRAGLMKGSMVTGGFMMWGGASTIPYAQRQPGDLYVSATHIGIIADSTQFWNAACTKCGPVKLSSYVGRRGYIVRRVKGAAPAPKATPKATPKGTPLGGATEPAQKMCKDPVSGGWVVC